MRLKLFEQDIARDLKDDIWHEEDDEGVVVLMVLQLEFFRHARDICIGDIDSAEACDQVVFLCSFSDFFARLTCRGRQANREYTRTERRGNQSC